MSESITKQYITLRLGDETFAVDVANVREILEVPAITRVPTAAPHMRGVANVRGHVIPVVDLRSRFGLPLTADTTETRILVIETVRDGEAVIVGAVADSVHDVIQLDPLKLAAPARVASRWRSDLIEGMERRNDEFIIVLNVAVVFSRERLTKGSAGGDNASVTREEIHALQAQV